MATSERVFANINLPSSITPTISEAYMLAAQYRSMATETQAALDVRGHLLDPVVREQMSDLVNEMLDRSIAIEAACERDKAAQFAL